VVPQVHGRASASPALTAIKGRWFPPSAN